MEEGTLATQYIVISGGPVTGFAFNGPFVAVEDAQQWAEDNDNLGDNWWIADLEGPL